MTKAFFVAGTDTDVGKTFISQGLLSCANEQGLNTAGYKPVSAGCDVTPQGLRNEDALVLLANSSMDLKYNEVNPIAFEDPVAPHLAAKRNNKVLSIDEITQGYLQLLSKKPDMLLVEGAGGWRLPLDNHGAYLSDFAIAQNLPVILVVGMKLGCLNHAMLTVEAIKHDGLTVAGWVANHIDEDMLYQKDNLESLSSMINAPCLGIVPKLDDPKKACNFLDLSALLQVP